MSGRWLLRWRRRTADRVGGRDFADGAHFSGSHSAPAVASAPSISLAIMPFYNASGDTTLNWLGASLAEMLGSDIGASSQVRMVSPDRLQQVLGDLHVSANSQVDAATLKRAAEFTNAQTVIFGQFIRAGSEIRISTTVMDLAHDTRTVVTTDVPDEKDLLTSVDKLAGELREKLTTDPKVVNDLKAHAERPSTTSVEALKSYEDGVALEKSGDNIKALEDFRAATTTDPDFALAYSRLAKRTRTWDRMSWRSRRHAGRWNWARVCRRRSVI